MEIRWIDGDVEAYEKRKVHRTMNGSHLRLLAERILLRALRSVSPGSSLHYSQEGEDVIVSLMLKTAKGFYVDIGAHHPTRFSNTYLLYRRGWRGMNIDAAPGSMEPFRKARPDDINIECAVSDDKALVRLHVFKEPALNTVDENLAKTRMKNGAVLERIVEMSPCALSEILDGHLPQGVKIDLLSIDIEGAELPALRSNDWNRYAPELIIMETLHTPLSKVDGSPTVQFLRSRGYEPVSKLFNSLFLKRNGSGGA